MSAGSDGAFAEDRQVLFTYTDCLPPLELLSLIFEEPQELLLNTCCVCKLKQLKPRLHSVEP